MLSPSLWSTKTLRAAPAKNRLCRLSAWQTPLNCRRFPEKKKLFVFLRFKINEHFDMVAPGALQIVSSHWIWLLAQKKMELLLGSEARSYGSLPPTPWPLQNRRVVGRFTILVPLALAAFAAATLVLTVHPYPARIEDLSRWEAYRVCAR